MTAIEKVMEIMNNDQKAKAALQKATDEARKMGKTTLEILDIRNTVTMLLASQNPEAMKIMFEEAYARINANPAAARARARAAR